MQNILLLNSENSIPDRTPAEFQTVWLQLPQSLRRSPGEVRGRGRLRGGRAAQGQGGGRGLRFYTIIERVQSESRGKVPTKNESDALSGEF